MWNGGKIQGEKEYCVLCGKETEYSKQTPFEDRIGYVEAVGQLCQNCHMELYMKDQGLYG